MNIQAGSSLAAWVREHSKNETRGRATPLESVRLVVQSLGGPAVSGDASVLGRFGDLGLGPGETIEYFGRAPLGEPLFICVRETVIALRMDEAELILLEGVSL